MIKLPHSLFFLLFETPGCSNLLKIRKKHIFPKQTFEGVRVVSFPIKTLKKAERPLNFFQASSPTMYLVRKLIIVECVSFTARYTEEQFYRIFICNF